jgi:hypothetical protein
MKVKTSELTGAALNWVVASIEWPNDSAVKAAWDKQQINDLYPFDKDWSLTGPLLERIDYLSKEDTDWVAGKCMLPSICCYRYWSRTSSVFTSIIRCYIASKLGDKVEVPDHLL